MPWKKRTASIPTPSRQVVEIDASGKVVGRLATQIAVMLMGKHRASYVPHIDAGAIIKVKNASGLVFTGTKLESKVHFRTSNRPGGLKRTPVSVLMQTRPEEVLKHAVKYMLPKNATQQERLKRLLFV